MSMAIVDTNWQKFLLPDSDIQPDVSFLVMVGEGGDCKSIGAHKFLLAGCSPVFRGQFFGPMRDTGTVFEIKNTTAEAFGAMIRYIYRSPGADTFTLDDTSCPQQLMELHELAVRYQILGLEEMTTHALNTLVITKDNMVFTATIAQKYKNTEFEDTCRKLQMKCLKFLYDISSGGVVPLLQQTKESFPEADLNILYELINVGHVEHELRGDFGWCSFLFNCGIFSGWGRLIFSDFDTHERKNEGEVGPGGQRVNLANIPKLGKCWKVIYDLKTDEYNESDEEVTLVFTEEGKTYCRVIFTCKRAILIKDDYGVQGIWEDDHELKIGEWNRIEITQEEGEDGIFFLSLSVGGTELGRLDVGNKQGNFTDVKLIFAVDHFDKPMLLKRLLVVEKC